MALGLAMGCAGTGELDPLDAPPPPSLDAAPAEEPELAQLLARSEARWRSLERGEYAKTFASFHPERRAGASFVLAEDEDASFVLYGPGLGPTSRIESLADDRAVLRSSFDLLPRTCTTVAGQCCVLDPPEILAERTLPGLTAIEEWEREHGEWCLLKVRVAGRHR